MSLLRECVAQFGFDLLAGLDLRAAANQHQFALLQTREDLKFGGRLQAQCHRPLLDLVAGR